MRGLNQTSERQLQRAISRAFESGETLADTRRRIRRIYSPVRADMIATTEITRAAVEGELIAAREIQRLGVQMVTVWQTRADEMVCPVCAPRNQTRQGDGWQLPPPAHPRCRCWISHEVVNDAS